MKRYFILFVVGIAAILATQSCKDETEKWTKRIPLLSVVGPDGPDVDELLFEGRPLSADFTVYATDSWSAEVTGCDKFSLNTTVGGSGKTIVTLEAPENEDGETREGFVKFYLKEELQATFSITQFIQEPYIEVSPAEYLVVGFGEDFTIEVATNQTEWQIDESTVLPDWLVITSQDATSINFSVGENPGEERTAELLINVPGKEDELFGFLTIKQAKRANAPTDLILDVKFNADGTATDASATKLEVKNDRLNGDNSTKSITSLKGISYAACFNNKEIARSTLTSGYYYIPYDSAFEAKMSDGFSYEVVFCTYYDPLTDMRQVKPFASSQAGGVSVCLQANSGKIQFETHFGTNGWRSPLSSVVPVANVYYHVVGVYNKTENVSIIYVNGKREASVNTAGNFNFQTVNSGVNRWFGIGADPSAADQGEASFYGEVAVARIYDAPMSDAEVMACYYGLFK